LPVTPYLWLAALLVALLLILLVTSDYQLTLQAVCGKTYAEFPLHADSASIVMVQMREYSTLCNFAVR